MRAEQRRLDSQGRVKSSESEEWEVLVLYGAPYRRLVAKNGKPLSAREERKEQIKLDQEMEKRRKQSERDPTRLTRPDEDLRAGGSAAEAERGSRCDVSQFPQVSKRVQGG